MTNQIEKPELEIPELPTLEGDELALLKKRADVLGVSYGPNIGIELLRTRINEKLAAAEADAKEEPEAPKAPVAPVVPERPLTEAEARAKLRKEMWLEHMRLIRCRIVCLNPDKADLKGEVFTVQNRILGKVSKYIPFGEETDDGWHIPKILYDNMLERKFVQLRVKKSADKREMLPEQRWVREFAIEVLPPLTKEELRVLANKQAAAAGNAV